MQLVGDELQIKVYVTKCQQRRRCWVGACVISGDLEQSG